MILIMASDYRAAAGIAGRLNLHRWQWKFLRDERELRGVKGPTVIVADNASDREDYRRVMNMIAECKAQVFEEHDYARRPGKRD